MLRGFRNRFIVCTLLTIPVLVLADEVQALFGYRIAFAGLTFVIFLLASLFISGVGIRSSKASLVS
jgi:hypothetical protein